MEKYRPPVFFENNVKAASQMGLEKLGTSAVLAKLGYEFYQWNDEKLLKLADGPLPEGNILALYGADAK